MLEHGKWNGQKKKLHRIKGAWKEEGGGQVVVLNRVRVELIGKVRLEWKLEAGKSNRTRICAVNPTVSHFKEGGDKFIG